MCVYSIKKKKRKTRSLQVLRFLAYSTGAGVQIRTGDLRITSALLYQLSYTGKNGGPTEIRTQVLALKGRCPRPLDYGTAYDGGS